MELVLTGRKFSAAEADRWGLVTRVVPDDEVLDTAVATAEQIAKLGQVAVRSAKEAVNACMVDVTAETNSSL